MEKNELIETIRNVVSFVVGHQNFQMKHDLTAADVDGWDSLSHMMIITELEKKFDIKFKLKELNKLKDMGSLIATIESKLAN
jgi:acyl carrier protein